MKLDENVYFTEGNIPIEKGKKVKEPIKISQDFIDKCLFFLAIFVMMAFVNLFFNVLVLALS
jgi:hypothetical protein